MRAFQILADVASGLRQPLMPLAATAFYSVLPIQWGKHAVKLSLAPHDAPPATPPRRTSRDALGEEVHARLASGAIVYDLRAQQEPSNEKGRKLAGHGAA